MPSAHQPPHPPPPLPNQPLGLGGDRIVGESGDGLGDDFLRVSRMVRRRLMHALEPWGLSPHQARALGVVARRHPVRPGEIAAQLRIAPRSVTDVLDALADRGLITRAPDPTDRRALVVSLTAEGAVVTRAIGASRHEDLAEVFGHLSAEERSTLSQLLVRVEEQLAQMQGREEAIEAR
ncbi:MAG TPA: MarR family transcriptional regulator [Phycicoccus sp.]|jgi:DNA-binding MarR family transcriptional regulator|nr:MarR family transcriptional regulator [Phycicoccus sp.]HQH07374.1 MarR family transcriptional regulator [Phycicoccus sp.]HQK31110.1 MarR family transcriptional regulator [Phycicoccus sp.]HQY96482.1 MarR family transcriptional regulator [Phycicoccus sp.]